MNNNRLFILLVCMLFGTLSCEKRDINGAFDGMWQMTRWNYGNGSQAPTPLGVYYGVQLKLMMFHSSKKNPELTYLSYFTRTRDSLKIYHIVDRAADTLCPVSTLQPYGVPASGGWGIRTLNSSHMVLTNGPETIYFRKY